MNAAVPITLGLAQWTGRANCSLEMNPLSLRDNHLEFKTSTKLPVVLEEFREYT